LLAAGIVELPDFICPERAVVDAHVVDGARKILSALSRFAQLPIARVPLLDARALSE